MAADERLALDAGNGRCQVLLSALRRHCDPFRDDCWSRGSPISRRDVRRAIREGRLETRHNEQPLRDRLGRAANLAFDAERVAYLLLNPVPDPLLIDVPAAGQVVVEDGLHRLAAAIMRGDELVLVDWSGDVSGFLRTFRRRLQTS